MRKTLKFTHGRKQYVKKQVSAEEASKNHKFVHLMVFKCEANWAYAMLQRQIVAAAAKDARNPNRVKYLAKKRLQRVSQSAQELMKVAQGALDAYRQVEIEAYASYM
jgi:hypothetical protein